MPCPMCPLRRSTPELHRHLIGNAADLIEQCNGFPCHDKHPTKHVLTSVVAGETEFSNTDCIGYRMYRANKETPGRFPEIVDNCHQLEAYDIQESKAS